MRRSKILKNNSKLIDFPETRELVLANYVKATESRLKTYKHEQNCTLSEYC